MMTVDIAINGKSIDKITVVHDGRHPRAPEYGDYSVDYERNGSRYRARVLGHRRDLGALTLARSALLAVMERIALEGA